MSILQTKYLVQLQGQAPDFTDGSEPICVGSDLYEAVDKFKRCHAHRRLVAIPYNFVTGEPTGQQGIELIRV